VRFPKPARRSRKPRKRIKQLSPRKAVTRQADMLWSRLVRERRSICEYPDCHMRSTEAHHLISRASTGTRWNLLNGVALCREHHELVQHNRVRNDELALWLLGYDGWSWLQQARHAKFRAADALAGLKGAK